VPETTVQADLLETIVAATRRQVEVRAAREPLDAIAARAGSASPRGGLFLDRLRRPSHVNVIAECKRRSPSKGVIRARYDPVAIAREYEHAGAAAISILTEATFFDGSLAHLGAVREAVGVPLLRKDFVVDAYQVHEARAAGADAVLLIVAALEQEMLVSLHELATSSGLAVLVEVHDEAELERAAEAGARIIGVNNRNLRTLRTDTSVSERLIARMPAGVVRVAESGLKTSADLRRLHDAGYDAFLIGESLMAQPSPGEALRSLVAGMAAGRAAS
jgi:indole-3-glycerol phosphate synthase